MSLLKAIGDTIYDSLGAIFTALVLCSGAAFLIFYIEGERPAEPDVLKVAFSESSCVKVELEEVSAKGQVITKSMLKENLNRCRAVENQHAAFEPPK